MQYSSEAYQTHKDSYTPSQAIDGKTATGIPVSSTNQHYPPSAPLAFDMQSQPRATWTTGLCGCCEDCGNCCLTCWCPCVTFGRIAEIADRGSSSCGATAALYTLLALVGCQCLYSCTYRSKIRAQYLTEESSCPDCLVHWCCESCALCQEYRELHNRGFDMKIGWHANMERQNRGVANMPPTVPGGMRR